MLPRHLSDGNSLLREKELKKGKHPHVKQALVEMLYMLFHRVNLHESPTRYYYIPLYTRALRETGSATSMLKSLGVRARIPRRLPSSCLLFYVVSFQRLLPPSAFPRLPGQTSFLPRPSNMSINSVNQNVISRPPNFHST